MCMMHDKCFFDLGDPLQHNTDVIIRQIINTFGGKFTVINVLIYSNINK